MKGRVATEEKKKNRQKKQCRAMIVLLLFPIFLVNWAKSGSYTLLVKPVNFTPDQNGLGKNRRSCRSI
jgi:hypothetical protein